MLAKTKQRDEALERYQRLAEIYGEDPNKRKRQLQATKNVAITLWNLGREEEAREKCRGLLEDYTALYGADHAETADVADLLQQMDE